MSEEKKPGKRLVSKGEYALALAIRAGIRTSAMVSLLVAGTCGALVIYSLYSYPTGVGLALALCFGAFGLRAGKTARAKNNIAANMEAVELLTRHNAARLPAQETLVRASSQSPTEHPSVLLRATQEGQETPAEQRLRPCK